LEKLVATEAHDVLKPSEMIDAIKAGRAVLLPWEVGTPDGRYLFLSPAPDSLH